MPIERIHKGIYQIRAPFDKTGLCFSTVLKGSRCPDRHGGVGLPASVFFSRVGPRLVCLWLMWSSFLNTHAHLDHSGGNQETKLFSTPRIHLHALDLPMAQSTEAQVEFILHPCESSSSR